MADIVINPGTSIQTTINNAAANDVILLNPGVYQIDNTININKKLTIRSNVVDSYPNIKLNGTTYAYILNFAANGIILDGLNIDNNRGGNNAYIHASMAINDLTINNCKIHHFRRFFVGDAGLVNGFRLTNSEVYLFYYTFMEISNSKNFYINNNWFHDQTNTSSGDGAISVYAPADIGTCEISDNYITGVRHGIAIVPSVVSAISIGNILVMHNTIDMLLAASKPANINVPYCCRYGTTFWSTVNNKLNGASITWRDNLITRTLVYPMFTSTYQAFYTPFIIDNCMFWDGYWYYWPNTGRYTYEIYCSDDDRRKQIVPITRNIINKNNLLQSNEKYYRPIVGHTSLVDIGNITMRNCRVSDPMFEMVGTTARQFYALKPGSPAIGTATDGANIGVR